MTGEISRFTSGRRGPSNSSWKDGADWAAGTTEGVDVVDGWLIGRPPAQASVPDAVASYRHIGSNDNKIHASNAVDGSKEWTYTTEDRIYYSTPISGADGWSFVNRPGRLGNAEPMGPF